MSILIGIPHLCQQNCADLYLTFIKLDTSTDKKHFHFSNQSQDVLPSPNYHWQVSDMHEITLFSQEGHHWDIKNFSPIGPRLLIKHLVQAIMPSTLTAIHIKKTISCTWANLSNLTSLSHHDESLPCEISMETILASWY